MVGRSVFKFISKIKKGKKLDNQISNRWNWTLQILFGMVIFIQHNGKNWNLTFLRHFYFVQGLFLVYLAILADVFY